MPVLQPIINSAATETEIITLENVAITQTDINNNAATGGNITADVNQTNDNAMEENLPESTDDEALFLGYNTNGEENDDKTVDKEIANGSENTTRTLKQSKRRNEKPDSPGSRNVPPKSQRTNGGNSHMK